MSDELMTAAASAAEPADGLRAVRSLRALADRLEALHVERARGLGWSWQQVAAALGVPGKRSTRSTGRGSADVREIRQARPRGRGPRSGRGAHARCGPDRAGVRAARYAPDARHGLPRRRWARLGVDDAGVLAAVRALPAHTIDADALAGIGIDLEPSASRSRRRSVPERSTRRPGPHPARGTCRSTPPPRRCSRSALREAIRCKHRRIDSGHLLLAAVRLDDTTAYQALAAVGVGPSPVREAVTAVWADVPVG